jgi:hypothetical protein
MVGPGEYFLIPPQRMPYMIENLGGGKYEVMNKKSGKGHGITTKANAIKQERLLRAIEHSWHRYR